MCVQKKIIFISFLISVATKKSDGNDKNLFLDLDKIEIIQELLLLVHCDLLFAYMLHYH